MLYESLYEKFGPFIEKYTNKNFAALENAYITERARINFAGVNEAIQACADDKCVLSKIRYIHSPTKMVENDYIKKTVEVSKSYTDWHADVDFIGPLGEIITITYDISLNRNNNPYSVDYSASVRYDAKTGERMTVSPKEFFELASAPSLFIATAALRLTLGIEVDFRHIL
jgi:hypothetical protein